MENFEKSYNVQATISNNDKILFNMLHSYSLTHDSNLTCPLWSDAVMAIKWSSRIIYDPPCQLSPMQSLNEYEGH